MKTWPFCFFFFWITGYLVFLYVSVSVCVCVCVCVYVLQGRGYLQVGRWQPGVTLDVHTHTRQSRSQDDFLRGSGDLLSLLPWRGGCADQPHSSWLGDRQQRPTLPHLQQHSEDMRIPGGERHGRCTHAESGEADMYKHTRIKERSWNKPKRAVSQVGQKT